MKRKLLFFAILSALTLSSCGITGGVSSQEPSSEAPTTSETSNATSEQSSIAPSSSEELSSSEVVVSSSIEQSSSEDISSSEASSSSSAAPAVKKYTITWKDEDGTVLDTSEVDAGVTPTYGKENPTKAMDASSTYTFGGWDPTVVAADKDTVYTATYTPTTREYEITWKNHDGTTLDTDIVKYGVTPEYSGATPTKASDSKYNYTFSGWNPGIAAVTSDEVYTAVFEKALKPASNTLPDTLYFSSNKGWTNVNAYAWNSDSDKNHAWPGVAMTLFKTNEYSEKVYKITGLSHYSKIIFNNGTEQTVDILATSIQSDKNAFYLESKNGEGKYTAGQWFESGSKSMATKGQNIFHAFDWPLSTILANLDEIEAQGFTAIQTSPLQPVKDYHESYNDTHSRWWRFYQPVGLCLGNSTTNILFSGSDGAAELSALTDAASKKGIRVIVDVIVNHLASTDDGKYLNSQVAQFSSDLYNDQSHTLHNYGNKVSVNYDDAYSLVHSDAFGKDLNTSNSKVQTSVYNFLKSLVDCGVTGFRFDAAKHIETKNDAGGGSSFWENTLGAVTDYAKDTYKATIWSYGEIINGAGPSRGYQQYLNDAWFYAVTAQPGWYDLAAENCVSWGESHDDYMHDSETRTIVNTGQDTANANYKTLAQASADTNMLYFVRPNQDTKIKDGSIGDHPEWGWQNGQVLIANNR